VVMPWEKAVAASESRIRVRDSRFLVAALLGMTKHTVELRSTGQPWAAVPTKAVPT